MQKCLRVSSQEACLCFQICRDGASSNSGGAVDAVDSAENGELPAGSEVVNFPDFVRVLAHFKPLKKNAEKDHSREGPEAHWERIVKHKKFKRYHHKISQLLKELRQLKRQLD